MMRGASEVALARRRVELNYEVREGAVRFEKAATASSPEPH
jgi:hypothetical protein